ncbi:protein translocase subunit [Cryptotrichosporon argae]
MSGRASLRLIRLRTSGTSRLRPLSTSASRFNAQQSSASDDKAKAGKQEQEQRKRSSATEDSGPPQSPFAVFARVFREEISKNDAWQSNVKQLQGDVDKLADSAALKRARDAYERVRITNMMKENPRLQAAAEDLKRAGVSVSEAVNRALADSEVLRAIARASAAAGDYVASATQPVRETATYKAIAASVEEAFEDTAGIGSRYGGYEDRDERRRKRERRAAKAGRKTKRVEENPEAGEALVLSDKQEAPSRLGFITSSPAYQRWLETYHESEAPGMSALRTVTGTVAGWFEENEQARVVRAMKEVDPDFTMDAFTKELREYIVPEVVDAYLSADREALKQWCGEATFNVLWATVGEYVKRGLVSESKILDIKHVDIVSGKMLENDVPVWVVSFASQEVLLFRSAKTGEAVVGSENGVEACRYAMVLTRDPAQLDNELTGGWKVVEMARRGTKGFM